MVEINSWLKLFPVIFVNWGDYTKGGNGLRKWNFVVKNIFCVNIEIYTPN